ncbi:glycine cleavage system protein GcvH [Tomitella fengzijianii]|uniref:Glycine cleavage system H protein n=1 Tax=Tomitella fengzijianii TaxID=2597660 RepID=A0A516X2K1_9ACTN|nr:glycine cleavage system protein GcvH [Tomitella fengzijianii]QDQ97319.1 glycine cleavage system protein GcvH [Tomitella fengzijianii]
MVSGDGGGASGDGGGADGQDESALRYTTDHEWVRPLGEDLVRVGITGYASRQLGDVVFADLPAEGAEVIGGRAMAEVESTKSVSEVFAPVSGRIAAANDALESEPERVNADPYGEGWLVEIRVADSAALRTALAGMMEVDAYEASTRM